MDDGEDKEATPEVTVIGSREEDNKTPVPHMPGEDVSMMDVGDMSLNVTEAVGSLDPVSPSPQDCKDSAKSPKKPSEALGPGSVSPTPTCGHRIPEGKIVCPSPVMATSEECAFVVPKEAQPSASTDILPELSESVLETLSGLGPVGHPEKSDENEGSQKVSFEELGPDSVPPMSSASFGFPASRGVGPTSPKTGKDKTSESEKPNEPQIDTVPLDASQGIAETTESLNPASLRNNSPKSPQKSLEEFGPDSVPPMASTGLGFPASRVENVPSPEKPDSKEKNSETGKEAATDTLLLPEFEGEEMIGDGELPDLVRVVNGGSGAAGKDSTPDFEEEERKVLVEERKQSKEASTSI